MTTWPPTHCPDLWLRDPGQVIGCGPAGLAVIYMLKARGAGTVVASDFSPRASTGGAAGRVRCRDGKLITAGTPADVAAPWTEMPDGDLLDAHGRSTTLAVARDGKPAVVVFYRGEWCPYCNLALRAYQDKLVAELGDRGVTLIAVSAQKADSALGSS